MDEYERCEIYLSATRENDLGKNVEQPGRPFSLLGEPPDFGTITICASTLS
jgi:hypothetical protein